MSKTRAELEAENAALRELIAAMAQVAKLSVHDGDGLDAVRMERALRLDLIHGFGSALGDGDAPVLIAAFAKALRDKAATPAPYAVKDAEPAASRS